MIEPIKFLDSLTGEPYLPDLHSKDIFELEYIENIREKFKKYEFQGIPVPRVNEIIQATIGKEFLMNWAARLGEEGYKKERAKALTAGTFIHEMIENFLLHGEKYACGKIYSPEIKKEVYCSFNNFLDWYNEKLKQGYIINVIYLEYPITNPWFGGTIDLVLNIKHCFYNLDENIIMDFKSSKSLSYEYILQTYAYLWSFNWNRTYIDNSLPYISGIGLLRIDKTKRVYNEFYATEKSDPLFLKELELAVNSMIQWFYNSSNIDYSFRKLKGVNNGDHVFSRNTSNK